MLTVKMIDEFDEFLKLEPIWNDLLSQSDTDFPFLTFEWLKIWWMSFGNGSEMLILLIKDGTGIIGIAPLMITNTRHRWLPTRSITFLANYYSNRSGFILLKKKDEAMSAIFTHLKKYNYDRLYLDFIEKDSSTYNGLENILNNNQTRYIKLRSDFSPYLVIDDTWEEYLKHKSKNFRKDIRGLNNLFNRLNQYEVIKYSNENIDSAVEQVLDISAKTWKFAKGTAIASDKKNITFYRSLANFASSRDWLNIYILKYNNRAIAFDYTLKYKGKLYSLKIGYDKEYAKLSPGTFLSIMTIKDAFENRIKEYDFLGNDESRKLRWTQTFREHYKYWIFKGNIYGDTLHFLESSIIPKMKKLFKR